MRLLLDTHVLIWYLEGDKTLSPHYRQAIVNANNDVLVSVASLWEIAIKINIGKLKISGSLSDVFQQLKNQTIHLLSIKPGHILQSASLPLHHRDPFDRMIIAQSQVEFLTVVSVDPAFSKYGTKLL
ncbi:type II toxin-antitoxin system VapC family toxin [soil metagenome]